MRVIVIVHSNSSSSSSCSYSCSSSSNKNNTQQPKIIMTIIRSEISFSLPLINTNYKRLHKNMMVQ